MNLPIQEECLGYFKEYKVPENIKEHCLKVQHVAVFLAKKMQEAGVNVNIELVQASAVLHDLFKMVGIKDSNTKPNKYHSRAFTKEELEMRKKLKEKFPGKFENEIAYEIFKNKYPELALTILREGDPYRRERTTEESIIHYADYRVFRKEIVLLDERFAYFQEVYPAEGSFWEEYFKYCKKEEKALFSKLNLSPEKLKQAIENE